MVVHTMSLIEVLEYRNAAFGHNSQDVAYTPMKLSPFVTS